MHVSWEGRERMEGSERERERREGEEEPQGMYNVHIQLLKHFLDRLV